MLLNCATHTFIFSIKASVIFAYHTLQLGK